MKRSALLVFVIAVTSICSGQWLEREVVIGDTFGGISPIAAGGIVVNPVSGNVYIESDPIQIFNPATQEKLRGPGATGLVVFCPGSGRGYVLGEESLLVLDAAADTVIGATVLPFEPHFHAYSPASNRLYLGAESRETLLVFDPDGDSVLRSIAVGARVYSLLWDSVWNRVYVGTWFDSTMLKVLDCSADTFVGRIQLGISGIRSLILSNASRKLYCNGSEIYVVSTDSLKLMGIVPGMIIPSEDRVVYSPVTDRIYWSSGALADTVFVIDCRSDVIRTRMVTSMPVLAASTLDGRVYVGPGDSPQVLVVDTNDSVVDSIPLPTDPFRGTMALKFRPDRDELYGVTSDGDNVFTLDASDDSVVGLLDYEARLPRQMVHNPAGNKLYLLCPAQAEILVLDSAFGAPKHIYRGVAGTGAFPVLNPALNQLYIADAHSFRVIDCNRDSVVMMAPTEDFSQPRAVLVPYLNKLYLFDSNWSADTVYAYEALRDTLRAVAYLTDGVPCAVYDPRSNRVFFACQDTPAVRVIDPVTDAVVRTFDLAGASSGGRMALNLDLGRLYYTDQSSDSMFAIDVLTDSVVFSQSLPWDVDSMFLDRRLGRLFMCSRDMAKVLVFDCGQSAIVDTFDVGYTFACGLLDDRNGRLYLSHGVVVDCWNDTVITVLPPDTLTPRCMAWDAIDNRVFQATTNWLYVYRDELTGVDADPIAAQERRHATIVRGVLALPVSPRPRASESPCLLDACGRKVLDLRPGRNDVRALPAGVYFVRQVTGNRTTKVVVQR